jgi:mono/diheme cytochrome c family protein
LFKVPKDRKMGRLLPRFLPALALLAVTSCHSSDSVPAAGVARVGQTRGSAVVLSRDESVAVACNRSASVVTVLALDPAASADHLIRGKTEIDLGSDWEPWAAVIGADDDTAYVISRSKHVVFRIFGLHSATPHRDDPVRDVSVGSEPTAIAIAPSGARVFTANWGEGTISVVTTQHFQGESLDLNEALAKTGVLGTVEGRPGLAHPRALAITDNGDAEDSDETLYATEFFSQPIAQGGAGGAPTAPATGGGGAPAPAPLDIHAACTAQVAGAAPACEWGCVCNMCADLTLPCMADPGCKARLQCIFESHCTFAMSCTACADAHPSSFQPDYFYDKCGQLCVDQCAAPGGTDGGTDASAGGPSTSTDGSAGAPNTSAPDAQPPPPSPPRGDLTVFDRNRQGFVYPIKLKEGTAGTPIAIAPVFDTGFNDSNSRPTSCFPNQLYAVAAEKNRLYVTSMCASPAGPLGSSNPANFKTVVHPSVFVVDTQYNFERPEERLVLTRVLESDYAADQEPYGRMPLIPNDLAIGPGTATSRQVLVTALGADAVFGIDYDLDVGLPRDIGKPGARFIDLHPPDLRAGQLPIGIAVSKRSAAPFALVLNDTTQNLSSIDLATSSVRAVEPTTEAVTRARIVLDSSANRGRRIFATGLDAWSFKGQAWLSCEGCHADGLSDGVTWFFARGPRRTIPLSGTYDHANPSRRRVMLWTGNVDEVHDVEGIVRTVAGGMGGLLWSYPLGEPSNDFRIVYDGSPPPKGVMHDPKPTSFLLNNLNGSLASLVKDQFCSFDAASCDSTAIADWNDIDAFVRTVRAPHAPTYLDQAMVKEGEDLFRQAHCAGCHGGPGFTLSRVFYTPGPENNGALPYEPPVSPAPDVWSTMLGQLRLVNYAVPPELTSLNPPGKSGSAPLRRWSPGSTDPVTYAYSAATAGADQINCVLRNVGTFPSQPPPPPPGAPPLPPYFEGIAAAGAPRVVEVRQDMATLALGETGFNVPSLVGLASQASFFHAGNASTLEEAFDFAFQRHYQALKSDFLGGPLRDAQVRALVAYLLSIDGDSPAPISPALELGFDPDLCAHAQGPIP